MTCLCRQIAGNINELSPVCLEDLWMFQGIDPEQLIELNRKAIRKRLAKDSFLFHQGDPANEMFLIKGGRMKLIKTTEDGREFTLDIRKAGDLIGENIFTDEEHYPVTAICLQDTFTCGFSRAQFEQLISNNPKVSVQIIKNLSNRISLLTSRVDSLATTNIEERLYRVLCNIAGEHGREMSEGKAIQFLLTHEELSFLTGAHRVSVTRALKALKNAGKLHVKGKTIILPSPETSLR